MTVTESREPPPAPDVGGGHGPDWVALGKWAVEQHEAADTDQLRGYWWGVASVYFEIAELGDIVTDLDL